MFKTRMLSLLMLGLTATAAVSTYAIADTTAETKRPIDIPAGDLASALVLLARQSGVEFVYDMQQIKGLNTHGLHGDYTPRAAVTKLLEGTNLTLTVHSSGALLIAAPQVNSRNTTGALIESESEKVRLSQAETAQAVSSSSEEESYQYAKLEVGAQASPSANASHGPSLEEVTVTARKRAENIQTVPVAITAFSAEDLRAQSVKTLGDLQQVPNLLLQEAVDDPQSLTFAMRGQKQNDATFAVDSSVGLYIDGVYVPRTLGMTGALLDLDRIEVLRGPQGTLYGRNTTGGAIALYTKNPSDQFGTSIDVTAGNYGAWNVTGTANLPVSSNLDSRFVFQRGKNDGYGHDLLGRSLDSEDSQYYRGKLRAKLGNDSEAILSGYYQSNRSGGALIKAVGLTPATAFGPEGGLETLDLAAANGLTNAQAVALLRSAVARSSTDFYANSGISPTHSDFNRGSVGLDIKADLLLDIKFRSITGYQHLHRDAALGSPVPAVILQGGFVSDDSSYSQEFQLLGETHEITWVAGLYGDHEAGSQQVQFVVLPALFGPGLSTNEAKFRNTDLAAFGQATWEFATDWHLTGGVRYSRDTRQADVNNVDPTGCLVPAADVISTALGPSQCPRPFKATFSEPTWLASLDHSLNKDVLVYVKISRGYRSGGLNTEGAIEQETFSPFAPEIDLEYEGGIKSEFLDHRLRFNLAGYYDDYKNIQRTTLFIAADAAPATRISNAASAAISGFEAEARMRITGQLSLSASFALTDAHYNKFVDFTGDRSNEQFDVPKWMGALSGRFVQPTGLGDLSFQADYAWKDRIALSPTVILQSQVTQMAYGLLNARINLEVRSWGAEIALFGRNITAEKYYDAAGAQGNGLGVNVMFAGPPRTFGVDILKRFGGI
jgi:iron complex outermembrane receptor protein